MPDNKPTSGPITTVTKDGTLFDLIMPDGRRIPRCKYANGHVVDNNGFWPESDVLPEVFAHATWTTEQDAKNQEVKPLTMEELVEIKDDIQGSLDHGETITVKPSAARRFLAAAERSCLRPITTAPWPIKWPETPGLWVEFHGPIGGYNVSFWDREKIDDYKRLEIPPRNQFYGPIPIPGEGGV